MPARFLGFVSLLLWLAAVVAQPSFASEPRVALVIGNSDYGSAIGKLKNPANDARLMAETLKGLGFKVDLVLDADQKAMKRAVKGFGAKLREAGKDATGLFYYAGHGVQVDGTNYLLPVGAEIEAEADVEIESIAADDVMTQMQSAGNAVNLVFLDACRNNPLAKASRSATRGLARLDAPRGSFVGYSTAPGDVAADGDGANSPYALALAEELKKPGISIEEAHRNVRAKVLAETGEKQTPWDSSSLTGPVVLAEKLPERAAQSAAQPAPQPQVQQQASIDKEALFWESIKDSKDPAEFDAYIRKYPDGTFAGLAKAKKTALEKAAVEPASPTQQAAVAEPKTGKAPAQATFAVSQQAKAEIEAYLSGLGGGKAWALAIARDGSRTVRTSCSLLGACIGRTNAGMSSQETANREAIKNCGGPNDCFLLYEGDRKVASVEIAPAGSASASQTAALTAPASPAQPESVDPAGTATSTAFAVGEVYDFAGDADGFKYRGELRVLSVNADGELEGEIDIRVTRPSGSGYTVRQDFRLQQQDGQVEIRCFHPRAIEGSFSKYSSDHFYLTRQAPGIYKGTNQDRSGRSGQIVLTRRPV